MAEEAKKQYFTKKNGKISLIFVFVLMVGFLVGRASMVQNNSVGTQSIFNRDATDDGWKFINPLLDCKSLDNISNARVNDLKNAISTYVQNLPKSQATEVAVYFKDLENGPNFGIGSDTKFFPASLLKVPLMIAVYKQAMVDPALLSKMVTFDGRAENNEHFRAPVELKENTPYSVQDVIEDMIKYSDNKASHVLTYAVDLNQLNDTYADLGIAPPNQGDYTISVKDYASFFRILYNSTVLSREFSERSLRLLSQTVFDNGIVAGVPKGTVVSHKFGERQTNSVNQLHDCGIVYAPGKPYLLCVMSRGTDFEKLDDVIADISKIVYTKVSGGDY